ncbi:alpha/beta fold hydrolase [Chloroflexota bacterium]
MKEGTVRLKDGGLFYISEGQGEPLVLLHSLGTSSESWHNVIEPLAKKFTVYAVDLMGHGNSGKPNMNYEIYHYAENVIELMDILGISTARVIGNSIGAMISLEMSVSFPQRVVKQVLVGCPASETAWEMMERLMLGALKYDAKGNPKPATMDDLSPFYVHITPETIEWINKLRAKAGLWCKKAHIAIALWDIMPKLPKVSCPTLVVFGDKDPLREKEQVLLRGIRGVKYNLIENAGHVPHIDAPEAFLKPVLEFL